MSTEMTDVAALLKHTTLSEIIEFALRQNGGLKPESPSPDSVFRRAGEVWHVRFAGQSAHVKPRIGLEYIAHLLANPREAVSVTALHQAINRRPDGQAGALDGDNGAAWQISDAATSEVIADRAALANCRTRLRDLETQLDEARRDNDEALVERLNDERDQLLNYLASSSAHNGQLRRATDTRERVRKSVSNAICRAIDAVGGVHEPLGRHLRNSIRTGSDALYDPEASIEWQL